MKLTRRRLLVGSVLAVAAVGGAWLAVAEHGPPFGVTRSGYRAITLGMTFEDVERIIGQPPGPPRSLYRITPHFEREKDETLLPESYSVGSVKEWSEDGVVIGVWLNQEGLVWQKWLYPESLPTRLLRQTANFWAMHGF